MSLKSHKSSGGKQSKASVGSKNVTIQVKRKKIIIPTTPEEKDVPPVVNEQKPLSEEKVENTLNQNKQPSIKKVPESIRNDGTAPVKKKTKTDKDDKVEIFENKELHLKEPKPKKNNNKKDKLSASELSQKHQFEKPKEPIKKEIEIPEAITVSELAQKISIKSSELIKIMMNMGVMATINQSLDQDTAILIIEELGHTATIANETAEEEMTLQFE